MRRRNPLGLLLLVLLASGALFALLVWGNYRFTQGNKGGEDFIQHWDNTRAFLRSGISPYSEEAAARVQVLVYGRPSESNEDPMMSSYPMFTNILYLPFAFINNINLARAIWMALLEVALILAAFLSMNLSGWRPKPVFLMLFLLFVIFWYHGLRPVVTGTSSPLVTLAVVGALLAIRAENDELAGVLVGFAFIKPEMVLVLSIYLLFWGIANRRIKIFLYTLATVALLSGFGMLLMPGWLMEYLRSFFQPVGYLSINTISQALGIFIPSSGARVGTALSILTGIILVVEWFLTRKAGFRGFLWTACLTIVASFWIGIQTSPDNFILALPAFGLIFAAWSERWRRYGNLLIVVTIILLFALIWLFFSGAFSLVLDPLRRPVLFFPLPFILFILLYWVRWWTIHPAQVWFDQLN